MDIPAQENAKVTNSTMLNLGFVIHASEILGFSEIVKKIIIPNWQPQNGVLVKRKKLSPHRNSLCDCNNGYKI